ncbi:hypothetical protein ESOMN_v1c00250 [Williamsoniiplasma somnilux]|uniref:Uncharacterized protein n=1 Tax=Williamsoniiplasma somnilux TaxID=215578 RepID=A0A2K8P085_9MOLU|nr:hypothetical protein [Williamsoniiplasma somnilux]ATZ18411.1 hypothetical protein ESOMN_v1c00250 [Williamsoniiplasma somnilux]
MKKNICDKCNAEISDTIHTSHNLKKNKTVVLCTPCNTKYDWSKF